MIRHFEQVWLKESWATYMESVWIQDHMSEDDFRFEMLENADAYMAECERYLRPLVHRHYESSWSLFDAHTYPGGCWRIHMLRAALGDQLFWSAVSKYLHAFQSKVVETDGTYWLVVVALSLLSDPSIHCDIRATYSTPIKTFAEHWRRSPVSI